MSEKEKNVMERLVKVLPELSEFDKGYIADKYQLGKVDGKKEA